MKKSLPFADIQLESQETAYNAYKFYKVLEERTSFSHTLVEDVKVSGYFINLFFNSNSKKLDCFTLQNMLQKQLKRTNFFGK
jgi:hypothetical protein